MAALYPHSNRMGDMMLEFLCCPESTCQLPAEVTDRWSLPSTDGPVAHVKTFCLAGHWFAMPEDALATRPARSASSGKRASLDTDRVVQVYGSREAAVEQAAEEVPARRMGTVEELGALAAFLCSVPAAYVTGTAVPVDGGLTYGY